MTAIDDTDLTLGLTDTPPGLDHVLTPLDELYAQLRSGALEVEEVTRRRRALLDEWASLPVRDHPYRTYATSISDRWSKVARILDMYLPSEVPGTPERRYKFEQVGPPGNGVTQIRFAHHSDGRLLALSSFDPQPGAASGTATPAIGIAVEPTHGLSRIAFQPDVHYSWAHKADVPTAFGNPNHAFSRGSLRLVAQKLNPQSGGYDLLLAKTVELWRQDTPTGAGYGWIRGKGDFPASDPGLLILTGKGEHLRFWIQLVVEMSKQDNDPSAFTTGEAYIDAYVPEMWAVETAL